MSRSQDLKRKRLEPNPHGEAELKVLNIIKSKENMGIWANDIKRGIKLGDRTVDAAIKSLHDKKLIKLVVNIQNKAKKHYMAAEFEPSPEITGGNWYSAGNLDTDYINSLKDMSSKIIRKLKVTTAEGLFDFITKNKLSHVDCSSQQIREILKSMVLDNTILEVKSTGLGEYYSIPVGDICYRINVTGGDSKTGGATMASIPCGVCPRISQCTPDGIISPSTCVYYKKWLSVDF